MPAPLDRVRLSKTLAFLLRHRPDAGGLTLDGDGWVGLDDARRAVSKLLRQEVAAVDIEDMVAGSSIQRFEIQTDPVRIRAVEDRRRKGGLIPPDILYHAASPQAVDNARRTGQLRPEGSRSLFLSANESDAWMVAHRRRHPPTVLYVDSTRARRHGIRFRRHRTTGLYIADRIPTTDVLNLQPKFAPQLSAGGLPLTTGDDGVPRVALIRVTRRSGTTWEIAKGKLEPGETPERAAVREVQEEMGTTADLEVTDYVGLIRYGFLAPGGLPRLKSIYLYLMRPTSDEPMAFLPRAEEGVGDVKWFTLDEACKAVTHSSLRPLMRVARDMVTSRAQPTPAG